jgi:hypothetical protein
LADILEVLTASIISAVALMMEAVSTSEISVSFYETTRRNIAEDGHLLYDFCTGLHTIEMILCTYLDSTPLQCDELLG